MIYSQEVENMCPVAQGVNHGAAPIPEEAKWVKSKEVKDISGLTHGVGWCAGSGEGLEGDRADRCAVGGAEPDLRRNFDDSDPPYHRMGGSGSGGTACWQSD